MTSHQPNSIDEYLEAFPASVQALLRQIRDTVHELAPEAVECLKYRMPTFFLGENLVHFAAYERHIGFYPTPSAMRAFEPELKRFVHAKGSVQFPITEPLPMDLIRRMVTFRVQEVGAKRDAKTAAIQEKRSTSQKKGK